MLTRNQKIFMGISIALIVLLGVGVFLMLYFHHEINGNRHYEDIPESSIAGVLDGIYNDTISPNRVRESMIESPTTFGYDDIMKQFITGGGRQYDRAESLYYIGIAARLVGTDGFQFGVLYGKGQKLSDHEIWTYVSHEHSSILISNVHIYPDETREEIKTIVFYDTKFKEYVVTTITRDMNTLDRDVVTYYKRQNGALYFEARGTNMDDSYTYSFNGVDGTTNSGLSDKFADQTPEFILSCTELFDNESTKLGTVYDTLNTYSSRNYPVATSTAIIENFLS